jgi:hypothetical protein
LQINILRDAEFKHILIQQLLAITAQCSARISHYWAQATAIGIMAIGMSQPVSCSSAVSF